MTRRDKQAIPAGDARKPGFLEVLLTNSPTLRCHLLEIVSSFFGKSEAVAQELPSRHAGHRALGLIDLEPQLGVTLMQQRRRIERIDALFHQSELAIQCLAREVDTLRTNITLRDHVNGYVPQPTRESTRIRLPHGYQEMHSL